MKSVQLLKTAAHLLETPGDFSEQDRKNTISDIGLFLSDQERRATEDQPGDRVSTDGEHWEYTDKVHVVSRVPNGKDDMKEFSITMTANDISMDMKTSIRSEGSAGTTKLDYEVLIALGLDGFKINEVSTF